MNAQDPNDILLAYLRGELDAEGMRALRQRLRDEPELRAQLVWLQGMAGEAFVERFDDNEAQAFAKLQQRVQGAVARRAGSPQTASAWTRFTGWLRGHALVLQGGLAVLVVAQAVVLSSMLQRPSAPEAVPQTAPAMVRGASESCLAVTVAFRPGVSLQQVTQWLDQYDASIVAGPDAEGRYRVKLSSPNVLKAFLVDPDGLTLTRLRQQPPGCTPAS